MVQKVTESRFGISKFGIPIEIRSLMSAGIDCTFLKVYMELGSYFLFLQEQIKDIIIIFDNL